MTKMTEETSLNVTKKIFAKIGANLLNTEDKNIKDSRYCKWDLFDDAHGLRVEVKCRTGKNGVDDTWIFRTYWRDLILEQIKYEELVKSRSGFYVNVWNLNFPFVLIWDIRDVDLSTRKLRPAAKNTLFGGYEEKVLKDSYGMDASKAKIFNLDGERITFEEVLSKLK
jgi:hypothetical protein